MDSVSAQYTFHAYTIPLPLPWTLEEPQSVFRNLDEFITTENNFVMDLKSFRDDIFNQVKSHPVLYAHALRDKFLSYAVYIDNLYEYHYDFISQLKASISLDTAMTVMESFLQFRMMQLHTLYLRSFVGSLKSISPFMSLVLQLVNSSPAYATLFQATKETSTSSISLMDRLKSAGWRLDAMESRIAKPWQRVSKYDLLLRDCIIRIQKVIEGESKGPLPPLLIEYFQTSMPRVLKVSQLTKALVERVNKLKE
jgi:hypothetical protein